MSWPHGFANQTGPIPLSQLDDNFNAAVQANVTFVNVTSASLGGGGALTGNVSIWLGNTGVIAGPGNITFGGTGATTLQVTVGADGRVTSIANVSINVGGGNFSGPNVSVATNVVTFADTTGTKGSDAGYSGNVVARLDSANQVLSGGATVVVPASLAAAGNVSANVTINCGRGPLQVMTNANGGFSFTSPANDGYCVVKMTNGNGAGSVSFTGFNVGSNTGDALTTTANNTFFISFVRIAGTSTYVVKAVQ